MRIAHLVVHVKRPIDRSCTVEIRRVDTIPRAPRQKQAHCLDIPKDHSNVQQRKPTKINAFAVKTSAINALFVENTFQQVQQRVDFSKDHDIEQQPKLRKQRWSNRRPPVILRIAVVHVRVNKYLPLP